tara:strand:- start:464 stop:1159 length:696 start_codon:yes stop_codon:yes gene_type:complete
MNFSKLLITLIIIFLILLIYFTYSPREFVEIINDNLYKIRSFGEKNFIMLNIFFFSTYLFVATFSLPFALILGLLSGMIFEPVNAILLVSFASTIGATFAFLLSRYLFADIVRKKYIKQYQKIDKGFKKYNNYYIFALRMCILFPFFLINTVLGLTSTRVLNFYLISQIGMLPATIIIVNIGNSLDKILSSTTLERVDALQTGLNIEIIILLTLLGLFPLLAKLFFKKIIN